MLGLRNRTWIIGGVVAALIGTGAIAARNHNMSFEDRADYATYKITKKLELNAEHEAAFEGLAAIWVKNGPMKSFRKSMFEEVKTLANGEQLSVEQINALGDKVKAEIDRRTDELAPQIVAFYNSLDGDQKSKIAARLDKMSDRMEKGGKHHRRGGKGKRGQFSPESE